MANFYNQKVRPLTKQIARAVGIREKRLRKPLVIPSDFDDETNQIIHAVREFSMTSPECIFALVNALRYTVAHDIEGDFVECGVWRGGSAMAAAMVLKKLGQDHRHLYLYDTFEGMSAPTADDVSFDGQVAESKFKERRLSADSSDWCRSPIDEVRTNLASTGYPQDRVHFLKGKVEDTIPGEMPVGPISILRLDTDWYESTRHEMVHLYPRLVKGGVLILDDYGHWEGARKAVDEYIEEHKPRLLLNRIDYSGRIAVKQ